MLSTLHYTNPLRELFRSVNRKMEGIKGRLNKLEGQAENLGTKSKNRFNNRINRACNKLDLLHGRVDPNSPIATKTLLNAARKYSNDPEEITFRQFLTDKLGINQSLFRLKTRIKAIERIQQNPQTQESIQEALLTIHLMAFGEPYDAEAAEEQLKLFSWNSEKQASNFIEQIIALEGDELKAFLANHDNKVFFKKLTNIPLFFGHILMGSISPELSLNEQLEQYSKVLKLVIEQEIPTFSKNLHPGIIEQFNGESLEKAIATQKLICDLLNKYYKSDTKSTFTEFIQSQNPRIKNINLNQLLKLMMERTVVNKLNESNYKSYHDRITRVQTQSLPIFVSFLYTLVTDLKLSEYDLQKMQQDSFMRESDQNKYTQQLITMFLKNPGQGYLELFKPLDLFLLKVLYTLSYDCLNLSHRGSTKETASKAKDSSSYQQRRELSIDQNAFDRLIDFVHNYKTATSSPAHGNSPLLKSQESKL